MQTAYEAGRLGYILYRELTAFGLDCRVIPPHTVFHGGDGAGNSSPCAQGSVLYDIENDVVGDARIEPMAVDERTLAAGHMRKLTGWPHGDI
ncbi:MAG: hypothetical protein LBD78_11465 [Spirochaetaceae bacterium]|nr:hypothetical protein [Spirochaetaceae bacterium]